MSERDHPPLHLPPGERLSLASQSDSDRRLASNILVTVMVAMVFGVTGGAMGLSIGTGPMVVLGVTLGGVVGLFGFAGVQVFHRFQLPGLDRWPAVVAADIGLFAAAVGLLVLEAPWIAAGVAVGGTAHAVARLMARSGAMVVSWELAIDDARVRFRRLVFSRPAGPWHSRSLEEARARVLDAGHDWFLEVGGVTIPVGSADEQAWMLKDEIDRAWGARQARAEGLREADHEALRSMLPEPVETRVATLVPSAVEARAVALALAPIAVVLLALGTGLGFGGAGAATVGLRAAVWLWAARLR